MQAAASFLEAITFSVKSCLENGPPSISYEAVKEKKNPVLRELLCHELRHGSHASLGYFFTCVQLVDNIILNLSTVILKTQLNISNAQYKVNIRNAQMQLNVVFWVKKLTLNRE